MKAVIFGASGMEGQGVLRECIASTEVTNVLVVGRSASAIDNPKVKDLVLEDLFDYSTVAAELTGYDACFFCLGVSAAGMTEAEYTRITHDLTIAAAKALLAANPQMTFIYVSGQGTDETEKGRGMWARVKGRTENAILNMGFPHSYMFRPGLIQPMNGIKSKTPAYRFAYIVLWPFMPLLKVLFPRSITTTERVGKAMIRVAATKPDQRYVHNQDMNELAKLSLK